MVHITLYISSSSSAIASSSCRSHDMARRISGPISCSVRRPACKKNRHSIAAHCHTTICAHECPLDQMTIQYCTGPELFRISYEIFARIIYTMWELTLGWPDVPNFWGQSPVKYKKTLFWIVIMILTVEISQVTKLLLVLAGLSASSTLHSN